MRDLLFPSSPVHRGALAESARLQARGWVMECRAIVGMYETAAADEVDFVHGDVAGTLHLSPRTAQGKAHTALALMAQRTRAHDDGVIEWTSPSRGVYQRRPQRTVPPKIPPGASLPPLPDE